MKNIVSNEFFCNHDGFGALEEKVAQRMTELVQALKFDLQDLPMQVIRQINLLLKGQHMISFVTFIT